ncbi:MAG: hypothetical protein Kow00103_08160 [Candidatus Caldatribacteriota bacterium]
MRKVHIFFLLIIMIYLLVGCSSMVPDIPNEEYDEENTILDYIKVFPNNVVMKVNQSQKFEVKAYNSDNHLIAIDVSQVKWVVVYECPVCGKVWNLSPTSESIQTTFTPLEIGDYEVWANYKGEWAKANVEAN